MNEWSSLFAVVCITLVFGGCGPNAQPRPAEALRDAGEPTQAQPKLRSMKLYIGAKEIMAELALTQIEIRTGMMFRTNVQDNTGMLFALPYTQRAAFWMKNCPCPLSAAYIDAEGVIQEIHDLEPHSTNSVIARSDNIRFVLETPRGWFAKNGIEPGVAVATEHGELYRTFFGRR